MNFVFVWFCLNKWKCIAKLWGIAFNQKLHDGLSWMLLIMKFLKMGFPRVWKCRFLEGYSNKTTSKDRKTESWIIFTWYPTHPKTFVEHPIDHRCWFQAFSVEETRLSSLGNLHKPGMWLVLSVVLNQGRAFRHPPRLRFAFYLSLPCNNSGCIYCLLLSLSIMAPYHIDHTLTSSFLIILPAFLKSDWHPACLDLNPLTSQQRWVMEEIWDFERAAVGETWHSYISLDLLNSYISNNVQNHLMVYIHWFLVDLDMKANIG